MIIQQFVAEIRRITPEEEITWMLDLGYQLTVCARGAYPLGNDPGKLNELLGFNELQHQIHGRIRTLRRGEDWTLDSFIEGLIGKAEYYGIAPDIEIALKCSRASISSAGLVQ